MASWVGMTAFVVPMSISFVFSPTHAFENGQVFLSFLRLPLKDVYGMLACRECE